MIDTKKLPGILAELLAAQKNFDSSAFVKTFAENAIVRDEGREYHGSVAIKLWNEETNKKYQTRMEPIAFKDSKGESVLTIRMSGTFPGSPLEAKFHFVISDGKIVSLRIG